MENLSVGPRKYLQIKNFVPKETCDSWTRQIICQRSRWTRGIGCFTYGQAWYLCTELGLPDAYFANAQRANDLVASLPGYREAMVGCSRFFENPTGQGELPVRARRENLGPYWSDTGLHIFETCETRSFPIHADLEGLIPYPPKMFDPTTRIYSCVLSVTAPRNGGGLKIWDEPYFPKGGLVQVQSPGKLLEYETGTLTIFDSFLPHQIQPFAGPGDYRITGVIHFLYLESPYPHWEYWF